MLQSYRIVRETAEVVAGAALGTVPDLPRLRRQGVDHLAAAFTDRMLDRVEFALDGERIKGVDWRAETLAGEATGAWEADFVGVLDVELPGYSVVTAFLARGACVASGDPVGGADVEALREGCRLMLERTPAAFAFLYSTDGVHVVPAVAVTSSGPLNPHRLYPRALERFYEEHFACFFGDPGLVRRGASLVELAAATGARSVLRLQAREPHAEADKLF